MPDDPLKQTPFVELDRDNRLNKLGRTTMTEHQMNILDRTGHTKISWDPSNQDEVDLAEQVFDEKVGAGWRAFRVSAGAQSTRMDTFDPQAREMMLVPQLKGG